MTAGKVALEVGRTRLRLVPAAVVAEAERSECRSGDGRGRAAGTTPSGAGRHAADAVASAAHSAANTAGARIPSELCGLCRL